MFALAEIIHRQNCQQRGRPHGRRAAGALAQRGETQGPPRQRQRRRDQDEDQCIGHHFRPQMDRARQCDGKQIDRSRHRRVGLEDINVETLTVEHALADDQPPADIDVEGQNLPHHDRHHEHGDDRVPG